MSFTSITSSISDYWEISAPAANLNPNRRISSDFCSLKRIILCIHYSHRGQLNLYQTKKSKPLSYAFQKRNWTLANRKIPRRKLPNLQVEPFLSKWMAIGNNKVTLWIIVGFPSFYPLIEHMIKLTCFYAAVNDPRSCSTKYANMLRFNCMA